MSKSEARRDAGLAGAIFAFLSALFWLGRARTYGFGDSAQHVVAALLWAVPHPPGYPLQTALGWAWSRPFADPAAAVNGLSGILHAAAASVLYLLLRAAGSRRAAALTGAALMALSPLFWYYSLVAEVRALNDLLALGAAYFAAAWAREGRARHLRLFSILFGLGLSHHPSFVFLVPAYAIWLSARRLPRRLALESAALAAAGLCAPYLLLAARLSAGAPPYNLFEVSGLADMPGLFLRTGLGGPLKLAAGAPAPGLDLPRLLEHLGWFAGSAWTHAGPAALALAAYGAFFLWKSSRRELAAWTAWLVFSAGVYAYFSSGQMPAVDPDYMRAVAARFHLLPLIAVFALAGRGAEAFARKTRPALLWALAGAAALGPLAFHPLSLARENPLREHLRAMLRDSKPGDILVLGSDDEIFAALDAELVRGEGGGRAFVAPTMFGFPPYVRRLRAAYPDLVMPVGPGGALTYDWALWKKLNPGRAVLGSPGVLGPILHDFPESVPQGVLVRVETAKTKAVPVPVPAIPVCRAWTQEIYLCRAREGFASWLARRSLLMERR